MATPRTPASAVEGMDQWFDSFQQFEVILEGMARASMDVKFKEELGAIEQWFKVLSESERTASLYSLLQHATQPQIKFFIAVLQQMAKADPMTAGLTPATGLPPTQKSKLSALSPLARSFSPISAPANASRNRQFLSIDSPIDAPSPISGNVADSAATLALQRARLRAMQGLGNLPVPASAPILDEERNAWGPGSHPLVKKISEATIEEEVPSSADTAESPALTTPSTGDHTHVETPESWSSMVPTPLFSMFPSKDKLQVSTDPMQPWSAEGVVPQIGDAAIYRKSAKGNKKKSDKLGAMKQNMTRLYEFSESAPMPTPVGIIPNTPYNLSAMNAIGMSPEDQLRAVQMFVNGYAPLPAPQQHHAGGRWRGGAAGTGAPPKSAVSSTGVKSAGLKSASSTGSGVINRENETDPELLKDIPAWLKALRLHKYAPCFEGLTWQEMVVLEESDLETKGVATVGARKRFLRLFDLVKKSQGMVADETVKKVEEPEPEIVPVAPAAVPAIAIAVC